VVTVTEITAEDTYKNLKEKTCHIPKLYISGTDDHIFIQYLIKDVSKDKSAKIELIEKCGHVCNIERADEFNKLSMQFWDNKQEIYINTK
jgi:pimeloyl-ACP methyl ester carboxylesterase